MTPRGIGNQPQTEDAIAERAKEEVRFSDRLYEILIAAQRGTSPTGGPGREYGLAVGELNPQYSALYNAIWEAALNVVIGGKRKKKKTEPSEPNRTEQE